MEGGVGVGGTGDGAAGVLRRLYHVTDNPTNEGYEMGLDQGLVDAARGLLESRFPDAEGIAAAMYTDDGAILTSVFFEPEWGGDMLCAETGAICEAEKLNRRVTASVYVSRLSASPKPPTRPAGWGRP